MILKIIAIIILFVTWLNDRSGIRMKALKLFNCQKKINKLEYYDVQDQRTELYKTISYILIAIYWGFMECAGYVLPLILIVNLLAYFRQLRYPALIRAASELKKSFPTIARMFIACGASYLCTTIGVTILADEKAVIMIGVFILAFFLPYLLRGIQENEKIGKRVPFLAAAIFISIGSVLSINYQYGTKPVAKVKTVVEGIHIGMCANDTIRISKEDARKLDGKSSFAADIVGVHIGDPVTIYEFEGCLGIRWFFIDLEN